MYTFHIFCWFQRSSVLIANVNKFESYFEKGFQGFFKSKILKEKRPFRSLKYQLNFWISFTTIKYPRTNLLFETTLFTL